MDFSVETRGLSKTYANTNAMMNVEALKPLDFQFERGKFYAIIGHSGSGKSTLLQLLGGIDKPTAGSVIIDGEDIYKLSARGRTAYRRRHIGFVFQAYNLLPEFTVEENILMPLDFDGAERDSAYLAEITEALGISDKLEKYPYQLSGGEQQRAAIARALIMHPSLLLADEPTGNLDPQNAGQVLDLFRKIVTDMDKTLILVTHDRSVAERADVIIRIENGVASVD